METPIEAAIREAMLKLAESLRRSAASVRDGYYDSEEQRIANSARRETLEDVASAIVEAFDV